MAKISVLIVSFNYGRFLRQCIESVLAQICSVDMEIVIVDDGSTDSCPRICDSYAERDSRVRVIHKENGGLSDARNAALDSANVQVRFFTD